MSCVVHTVSSTNDIASLRISKLTPAKRDHNMGVPSCAIVRCWQHQSRHDPMSCVNSDVGESETEEVMNPKTLRIPTEQELPTIVV